MKHLVKSAFLLIAVNLIPIFGVIFLGWDAFSILIFYWVESLITGIMTIRKIQKAEGKEEMNVIINNKKAKDMTRGELVRNFAYFYGVFMLAHIFFIAIFGLKLFGFSNISFWAIVICSISVLISHYLSYRTNFINNEEYKKFAPSYVFYQPFKRIFVMQFIIILGLGFFVVLFNLNSSAVILPFVVFKTLGDVYFHWIEHSGKAKSMPLRFSSGHRRL